MPSFPLLISYFKAKILKHFAGKYFSASLFKEKAVANFIKIAFERSDYKRKIVDWIMLVNSCKLTTYTYTQILWIESDKKLP